MRSSHLGISRAGAPAVLGIALLLCSLATAQAAEPRKWALLSDAGVQQSGVAELLAVELGKQTNLVWLERDAIAKVADEQTIGRFAEAGVRLQLGRQLGADTLLAVTSSGLASQRTLRVTIADCASGARLLAYEPPAELGREEKIARIGRLVAAIAQRFPDGVQKVVGVSPFRSLNLVHDFDALQTRYADLLGNALAMRSGVAVIATDEARAIGQELLAAGGADVQRRLPLMAEGEYRMSAQSTGLPTTVAVTIKVSGGSARSFGTTNLTLTGVSDWLVTVAVTQLLQRANAADAMSAEEQAAALTRRAEEFSLLGDYAQATALRESAVVLGDRSPERRLKLIADYRGLMHRNLSLPPESVRRGNPDFEAAAGQRVDAYIAALEHFEFLIRLRQIDAQRAIELASRLTTHELLSVFPYDIRHDAQGEWRMGQEQLVRAERAEEEFFERVYPLVRALPGGEKEQPAERRLNFLNRWVDPLWRAAQLRIVQDPKAEPLTEYFLRIVTQVVPDGLELRNQAMPQAPRRTPAERGAYADFLARMAAGTNRMASLLARYEICHDRFTDGRREAETMKALLPDVEKLREDFRAYCRDVEQQHGMGGTYMRDQAASLVLYVRSAAGLPPEEPPKQYPTAPKIERTTGALRIEPLRDIKIVAATNRVLKPEMNGSRIREIVRCGPNTDAYLINQQLYFMHQKDELVEAGAIAHRFVRGIAWDGRRLWIASSPDLLVLDEAGRLEATIGPAQGLPPSRGGLLVHPVGPGRVIAVGSFGQEHRAWCALVEAGATGVAVRVFHEATLVKPAGTTLVARLDTHLAFEPYWTHTLQPKPGGEPLVLVGRQASTYEAQERPLVIDPRTLAVSVYDHDLKRAGFSKSASYVSQTGALLEVGDIYTFLAAPMGEKWPDGRERRRVPVTNPAPVNPRVDNLRDREGVTTVLGSGTQQHTVLADDGWIYVPGHWWFRIDPKTWTAQRLMNTGLPRDCSEDWKIWNSRHYGLVGTTYTKFYRISVDETAIPKAGEKMEP